jgi:hypothetical protein
MVTIRINPAVLLALDVTLADMPIKPAQLFARSAIPGSTPQMVVNVCVILVEKVLMLILMVLVYAQPVVRASLLPTWPRFVVMIALPVPTKIKWVKTPVKSARLVTMPNLSVKSFACNVLKALLNPTPTQLLAFLVNLVSSKEASVKLDVKPALLVNTILHKVPNSVPNAMVVSSTIS